MFIILISLETELIKVLDQLFINKSFFKFLLTLQHCPVVLLNPYLNNMIVNQSTLNDLGEHNLEIPLKFLIEHLREFLKATYREY